MTRAERTAAFARSLGHWSAVIFTMPNPEANAPDHYRLFIAVLIPVPIKSEMAAVQTESANKGSQWLSNLD
jgi:hypothetical protein